MSGIAKPAKPVGIYLVVLFFVLATIYSFMLFIIQSETYFHPINVVIDSIAIISVIGLWMMKKWGAALTTVLSGIYLMMDMANLQSAYLYWYSFTPMELLQVVAISSVELVLSVVVAAYISRLIFTNKFT